MLSEHAKQRLIDYVESISPIPNACMLLTHLADRGVLASFKVGEEPTWVQIVAACLLVNPHISVSDVASELRNQDVVEKHALSRPVSSPFPPVQRSLT